MYPHYRNRRARRAYKLLSIIVLTSILFSLVAPPVLAARPSQESAAAAPASQYSGQGQMSVQGPMGVSVNTFNGNLYYKTTLFVFPAVLPLDITLTYNSLLGGLTGAMGYYGWRHSYDISYLVTDVGQVVIQFGDGHREAYPIPDRDVLLDITDPNAVLPWASGQLTAPQPDKYVLTTPQNMVYYFDSARHRHVTRIEHPSGQALTFEYTAQGLLSKVRHTFGQEVRFGYTWRNGLPYLTTITDPVSTPARQVALHESNASLAQIIDAEGNRTAFGYTISNYMTQFGEAGQVSQLASISDPLSNALKIFYQANRVSYLSAPGYQSYFGYNEVTRESTVWQGSGLLRKITISAPTSLLENRITVYQYDDRGRVSNVKTADGTRYFAWDDHDHPTMITDERGLTTHYRYDSLGKLLSRTDPIGHTVSYSYHPTFGGLTKVTDANLNVTEYLYDERGNLVTVKLPDGGEHTFDYDEHGLLTADTSPEGQGYLYRYDSWGHLAESEDPLGHITTFANDPQGNVLGRTDPNSNTASFGYDKLGRLRSYSDPLGNTTGYAYDAAGNLTAVTDPRGYSVEYRYDGLGRLTTVVDPLANITRYSYNTLGKLVDIQDAAGRSTELYYDTAGRLTAEQDPLGRLTAYRYDPTGNPIRRTSAGGEVTSYSYDGAGRLTGMDYPGVGEDIVNTYDAAGNLIHQATEAVSLTYQYNAAGAPTLIEVSAAGLPTKTVAYTYDDSGRRVSMTDPDGGTTVYTYTLRGELETLVDPSGGRADYTYDDGGRLIRQDNANGTYVIYTYNQADQLTSLVNYRPGGDVISSYGYTYDAAGNTLSRTDAGGATTHFTYDPLDRLTRVLYADGRSVAYSYDRVGNRTQMADSALGVTTYHYDAANQLTSVDTPTQTISLAYDSDGNMVSRSSADGVTAYDYDHENHLTAITYPDATGQSYTILPDSGGLRLSHTDRTGATRYFTYDQGNTLIETDEDGVTQVRFTAGLGLDEWLTMDTGTESYVYHRDALGSVTGLTDAAGAPVAAYSYGPFGKALTANPLDGNPFRFTGRRYQPDSGLYHFRAREYDPALGRFTGPDPMGGFRFDPATHNRYSYVLNNPLSYTDPTGEFVISGAILIGTIVYGLYKLGQVADQADRSRANYYKMMTVDSLRRSKSTTAWAQEAYRRRRMAEKDTLRAHAEGVKTGGQLVKAALGNVPVGASGTTLNLYDLSDPKDAADAIAGGLNQAGVLSDSAHESYGLGRSMSDWMEWVGGKAAELFFDDGVDGYSEDGTADDDYTNEGLYGPGNDHQDDTLSVASPQAPRPGATGLTTYGAPRPAAPAQDPVYRANPRVALLWNGFAREAAAFLTALGEPYQVLYPDFSPEIASLFPVLLIPSGGLYGLEDSGSFRIRLETYVEGGGVLLVSAQQHGYEFSALPGDLGGYGWTEDQSCFDAAVSFPGYHPALSSFDRAELDLLVDGYFTAQPEEAVVLLERNKNGFPAALLYPYGQGIVMATTVYADWGSSNYQYSADDHLVWRDMLAWATLGALPAYDHTLPEYAPNHEVALSVQVDNAAVEPAAAVGLVLLDPNKRVTAHQVVTTTVGALTSMTLPFTTTAGTPLGAWSVDYLLLDADGTMLQDQAVGAAFVVSSPALSVSSSRYWDLWITAPNENFVSGSSGQFTLHARNRTDAPIDNARFLYNFPHHMAENRPGGPDSGSVHIGTVQPDEEVTALVERDIMTNDRLFANLYSDYGGSQTSFQIRIRPASADVSAELGRAIYYAGEPVTVTAVITNLQPAGWDGTLRLRVLNPEQLPIHLEEWPLSFEIGGQALAQPMTVTMPAMPVFGLHAIQIETEREGTVVGFDQGHFDVEAPRLRVSIDNPAGYRLGQDNGLTFGLENQGGSGVTDGLFQASLTDPDGTVSWQDSTLFSVPGWGAIDLGFTVPFSGLLGVYTFDYTADYVGYTVAEDSHQVAAAYAVTLSKDKARYSGGETMALTVGVQNIGDFKEALDIRVEVPAAGFDQLQPAGPDPAQTEALAYSVALPPEITAGVHPITVTLGTQTGASSQKAYQFIVLPAELELALGEGPYLAGGSMPLLITNVGGGVTGYSGASVLRDSSGRLVTLSSAVGILGGGERDTIQVPIPANVRAGIYTLQTSIHVHATGGQEHLWRLASLAGMEAELAALTEHPLYGPGDPITATAWITNSSAYTITGATLELDAISMLGSGPFGGRVQDSDGRPLPGARVLVDNLQGAWTNLAGEFLFDNLGVGDHRFQVTRTGYQDYDQVHLVAGPQVPITLTLFPLHTASLSGTVRVSGGVTIVVGADLQLAAAQPAHLRTGPAGDYYYTQVEPGSWPITVTAPGFETYTGMANVALGENILDIQLTPLPDLQPEPVVYRRAPGPASPPPLTRPAGSVSGAIITHTTWTTSSSPYLLTADVTVNPGITLTIEPGVVVMGNSTYGLIVQGHLQALGTVTQPITFTSSADTGAGQWKGLLFNGGTGHLRHAVVRYAGYYDGIIRSAITAQSVPVGRLILEHCEVRDSYQAGVVDYGIYAASSHLVLSDTLLANLGDSSADWPLRTHASYLNRTTLVSVTFESNAQNRILVTGGSIAASVTLSPHTGLEGYSFFDNHLTVPAGITLTIEPGVTVRVEDGWQLHVLGHVQASGTVTHPVVMSSAADNGAHQWEGLVVDGGTAHLEHTIVRYAGDHNGTTYAAVTALNVPSGGLTLESCEIRDSYDSGTQPDFGVYAVGSHLLISDTLFTGLGDNTADYPLALDATSLGLTALHNNTFGANAQNRIRLDPGTTTADSALVYQTGLEGYVLNGDLIVGAGTTMTVPAGMAVRGVQLGELKVAGHLQAEGTETEPILFTATSTGSRWGGLVVDGGSAVLRHVEISYGGYVHSLASGSLGSCLWARNSSGVGVQIEASEVHHCTHYWGTNPDYTIYALNSRLLISDTILRNNTNQTTQDYVIHATGASSVLTVTGSTLQDSPGWGLYAGTGVALNASGNTFSGLGHYVVRTDPGNLGHISNNSYTDTNSLNRILLGAGTLTADATLESTGGVAYELDDDLTVATGVTLTLEPGGTLMGQGSTELQVQGHLEAVGTPSQVITFTSATDTGSGQWSGLVFNGGSGELINTLVRYGCSDNSALASGRSNITVMNSTTNRLRLIDSEVAFCATGGFYDYGLYIHNSEAVISNTLFHHNGNNTTYDFALYASTSGGNQLTVVGNTFQDNAGYAVRLGGTILDMRDNTFASNGLDRIRFGGTTVADELTLAYQTGLQGYEFEGDLTIAAAGTLTVGAGLNLIMARYAKVMVYGHLETLGTEAEPIVIGTTSTADRWYGAIFNGGSGHLLHTTLRYGGYTYNPGTGNIWGNLIVHDSGDSLVYLESCHLFGSNNEGITVQDGRLWLEDTVISGNGQTAASDAGLLSLGASSVVTVSDSTVSDNTAYGVRIDDGTSFHLAGTTFSGNSYYPLRVDAKFLPGVQPTNVFTGNAPNRLVTFGTLSADATFHGGGGLDAYDLENMLVVGGSARLTVEPGVKVVGRDAADGLRVYGELVALGTEGKPITFTSLADTGPAQWSGILLDGGRADMHQATVRYGGGNGFYLGPSIGTLYGNVILRNNAQLHIESGAISRERDQFGSSKDAALMVLSGRATVSDTLFYGNCNGTNTDAAIYGTGAASAITITNSTVQSTNGYGMLVEDGAAAEVRNTSFEDNLRHPIAIDPANLHRVLQGNTFANNSPNRLLVLEGTLAESVTLASNGLEGYELERYLTAPPGTTVTIEPGVTIRGQTNAVLIVQGHLEAVGTPNQPITFTSSADTGGNQWGGIGFDGGSGVLRHATVRYGGRDQAWTGGPMGNITARDVPGELIIESCQVLSERSYYTTQTDNGIYALNSRVLISDTLVSGNGNGAIDVAVRGVGGGTQLTILNSEIRDNNAEGIRLESNARAVVRHSTVTNNSSYEVNNQGNNTLTDMRYNWWGASPPSASSFYREDLLHYDPWIITGTFVAGYPELARDVYEENDASTSAALIEINSTLGAFLHDRTDADVYRVEIEEPGQLLAVADPSGTPLALQVTLLDMALNPLDGASGAIGEIITATAPVEPGLYLIELTGDNTVPGGSSHLPYRLTLLQADPRADLLAGLEGQEGQTYHLGAHAVNLDPGAGTSITAGAPPSLTLSGGYYLWGQLTNGRGQELDQSLSPFFIGDGSVVVELGTEQGAYRPGQSITVTGRVHNTGQEPVGPYTLTVSHDGTPIYADTMTLAAGTAQSYLAITTAPTATGEITLTAAYSSVLVAARVPIAEPEVDITLDVPELALPGSSSAELVIANNGLVHTGLTVSWGTMQVVALAAGELAVLTRTLELTETAAGMVEITGDLTQTLPYTVTVSAEPILTVYPEDPQREGDVVLPYALVNPGTVDLEARLVFDLAEAAPFAAMSAGPSTFELAPADLPSMQAQGVAWLVPQQSSGATVTRTHTLPAGSTVTDSLVINLDRGTRPYQATLLLDRSLNAALFSHSAVEGWSETVSGTVAVRGMNDLQFSASGAPTVTVEITNVGWNGFSGTLRVTGWRAAPFASQELPLSVPVETTRVYTAALDLTDLEPGPYDIKAEVWSRGGELLFATALTGSVPAPIWAITAFPAQTTLLADEVVTLTFQVENQGQAPGLAHMHLAVGDLSDADQTSWVPAGGTAAFSTTLYVPLDMPTMDILAGYSLTDTYNPDGLRGTLPFHVDGISLTTTAATDRPSYLEGDPFTLTLTVTNQGARGTGALSALTAFNGITQTAPLSLTAGGQVALSFPYTATFAGDRKLFYGLYGQYADRGAYLNTIYLYRENLGATLATDRQVYQPGETVSASLVTTLTQGTLTAYPFDEVYTLTLGTDTGFQFSVPADAERGSHPIYYVVHGCDCLADGREQSTWFDVAAPWVRVLEAELEGEPFEAGGLVTGTFTIASDTALEAGLEAWLRYPDGSEGAATYQPVQLEARLDNQVRVGLTITDSQMGLHRLLFKLDTSPTGNAPLKAQATDPPEGADGAESFDLGPAGLDRVITDQEAYATTADPVYALLDIYAFAGGPATVTIRLDDGSVTMHQLAVNRGYVTYGLLLDGPIPAGDRALTVTLEMDGYHTSDATAFAYGTSLPDLQPSSPSAEGGGVYTRTLAALVTNIGSSAAPETLARFYDGDPDGGGQLLGQVVVPALGAADGQVISLTWDIQNQGGDHALYLRVDPVDEYDQVNNTAYVELSLPRLSAELNLGAASVGTGRSLDVTTVLTNLQGAASLPVTITLEVRSPAATTVYSQTLELVLAAGEARHVDHEWQVPGQADLGTYTVLQEAIAAGDEAALDDALVTIVEGSYDIYLPLILRQ